LQYRAEGEEPMEVGRLGPSDYFGKWSLYYNLVHCTSLYSHIETILFVFLMTPDMMAILHTSPFFLHVKNCNIYICEFNIKIDIRESKCEIYSVR
jgi:hypothetical protein